MSDVRAMLVLQHAAAMQSFMTHAYNACGPDHGKAIAQRCMYEIGEIVAELHGREQAAVRAYGVADALTTRLPLAPLPIDHVAEPEKKYPGTPPSMRLAKALRILVWG